MSTCWSKTCSLSPVPPGRPAVARWRPGGAAGGLEEPGPRPGDAAGGLEEPGPRPGGAAWGLDPEGSTTAPAWGPGGGECLHQTGNIQGGSQGTAFTSSSFISLKKNSLPSSFSLPSPTLPFFSYYRLFSHFKLISPLELFSHFRFHWHIRLHWHFQLHCPLPAPLTLPAPCSPPASLSLQVPVSPQTSISLTVISPVIQSLEVFPLEYMVHSVLVSQFCTRSNFFF